MLWLRILVLVFIVAHGVGHSIWFIGAWIPQTRLVADGAWILPGGVAISDPAGKLFGILALAAMVVFLLAAWALLQQQEWWRLAAIVAVVLSVVSVVPWWSVSPGTTAFNAMAADVLLAVFLALPWSSEVLTA